MSSTSPLPSSSKRPALNDRPLSAHSLSSSAKQSTQKAYRHHVGGQNRLHTRNPSYGRALGKAGKIDSAQNLVGDGARHHRNKSGSSIPSTSPKVPVVKRNSSHVALAKNTSHASLRKNKSANALARNLSHTQLPRKTGPGPTTAKSRRESSKKHRDFQLAEMSSDDETEAADEAEAEWEDSTTQSPKLTRSNSAVSTQPASTTIAPTPAPDRPPEDFHSRRTSSPLETSLRQHQSTPNFGARASSASPVPSPEPPTNVSHLQYNPRSSRAPPAISSISAQASRDSLVRKNSSFTRLNRSNTPSSRTDLLNTPNTAKTAIGSSSTDAGVSHFLSHKAVSALNHERRTSSGSDCDSPSSFLPHYHPQQSTSPEKTRLNGRPSSTISKPKSKQNRSTTNLPSRTQQRLELQRRETMRTTAPTTPSTPPIPDGQRGSSAVSLQGRSGSHGRNRGADLASPVAGRMMIKQEYEAAERQLAVVRRFRNPVVEAVGRLKEARVLNLEKGVLPTAVMPDGGGGGGGARTGLRRGGSVKSESNLKAGGSGVGTAGLRSSIEDSETQHRPSLERSRPSSSGRSTRSGPASAGSGGKVRFRRQGSHDDIGLSRSQGSYDSPDGDHDGDASESGAGERGVSAEVEMMRRIWDSREVYDKGEEAGRRGDRGVRGGRS